MIAFPEFCFLKDCLGDDISAALLAMAADELVVVALYCTSLLESA